MRKLTKITWFLLIGLLAASGCRVNPATGRKQLVIISEEEEVALGAQAAPDLEKQFKGRVANTELQDYVSRIGKKVAKTADRDMPYEFTLLASEVPNAFALPGGKVYVTAGLMSRMSNERQLAAVLGHEIGHVCALHNVNAMQRQLGANILVEIAQRAVAEKYAPTAGSVTKYAGLFVNLRYGRTDEYQADELGIRYLTRAGYHPWGMVELLEILFKESQGGESSFMELFQTHPLTSKRIDDTREYISLNYTDPLPAPPDPNAENFMKMRVLLVASLKSEKL